MKEKSQLGGRAITLHLHNAAAHPPWGKQTLQGERGRRTGAGRQRHYDPGHVHQEGPRYHKQAGYCEHSKTPPLLYSSVSAANCAIRKGQSNSPGGKAPQEDAGLSIESQSSDWHTAGAADTPHGTLESACLQATQSTATVCSNKLQQPHPTSCNNPTNVPPAGELQQRKAYPTTSTTGQHKRSTTSACPAQKACQQGHALQLCRQHDSAHD